MPALMHSPTVFDPDKNSSPRINSCASAMLLVKPDTKSGPAIFCRPSTSLFRPIFAFLIVEIGTRRIVHVGVTWSRTSAWTAQQLGSATPPEASPRFLVRDRDGKFGSDFDEVAAGAGNHVRVTPYKTPNVNTHCERLLGSVRRACLDHILVVTQRQMLSVLSEYCRYYNRARPHQGIAQRVPEARGVVEIAEGRVVETPVLGGLHHDYEMAA
ncbi:MAG: putative transposase [Hyphomicrobiaceae bacterium]|jgi:putative transposase